MKFFYFSLDAFNNSPNIKAANCHIYRAALIFKTETNLLSIKHKMNKWETTTRGRYLAAAHKILKC